MSDLDDIRWKERRLKPGRAEDTLFSTYVV